MGLSIRTLEAVGVNLPKEAVKFSERRIACNFENLRKMCGARPGFCAVTPETRLGIHDAFAQKFNYNNVDEFVVRNGLGVNRILAVDGKPIAAQSFTYDPSVRGFLGGNTFVRGANDEVCLLARDGSEKLIPMKNEKFDESFNINKIFTMIKDAMH